MCTRFEARLQRPEEYAADVCCCQGDLGGSTDPYCWWFRNPAFTSWGTGSLSHYLQGFVHPRCQVSEPSTVSHCFKKRCVDREELASLKLTAKTNPWKWKMGRTKKIQPSIFRGQVAVSFRDGTSSQKKITLDWQTSCNWGTWPRKSKIHKLKSSATTEKTPLHHEVFNHVKSNIFFGSMAPDHVLSRLKGGLYTPEVAFK